MSNQSDTKLKIYEVTNRATGDKSYQPATNAEDACRQAGWQIGDCFVNEQRPRRKPFLHHDPLALVKIPCHTCPFQYAECRKPSAEECLVQHDAPDVTEWFKQVCQARLCPHVGCVLTKKDYNLSQKWLPEAQAIEELGRHHSP